MESRSGDLRIVAVADTHSKIHSDGISRISALKPDCILHGGDIGDLRVLDELAEVAPVLAVRGNIDGLEMPDSMAIDVLDEGRRALRVLLLHIALAGPRVRADARKLAKKLDADLIVCGHSHVPFAGRDRGITVFNPGSIGPRRFTLPIIFGELTVSRARVDVRHVDCETGLKWMPPGRISAPGANETEPSRDDDEPRRTR